MHWKRYKDIERDDSQPRAIRFDKRINKTGKTDKVNRTTIPLFLSYGDESLPFSSVSKINEKSMKRIGLSTVLNWFWPESKTKRLFTVTRRDEEKEKPISPFFPFLFSFFFSRNVFHQTGKLPFRSISLASHREWSTCSKRFSKG